MKISTATIFIFLYPVILFAQDTITERKNTFGIKGGIADMLFFKELGFNTEFYFERSLDHGFFLGLNAGVGMYNDFPEEFNATSGNMQTGVPEAIDSQLIGMNVNEAFDYRFRKYASMYSQLYVKYQPPIKILGYKINAMAGLMLDYSTVTSFSLGKFSFVDNKIVAYTPRYGIANYTGTGWMIGLGIEREMMKNLVFSVDAKYNVLFAIRQSVEPVRFVRVGIGKRF